MKYTESELEKATLEWLQELGYEIVFGPTIAPDGEAPERKSYGDIILFDRLKKAVARINPRIPAHAQEEAIKKVINVAYSSPSLVDTNHSFHRMLVSGVEVEYRREDGSIAGDRVLLMDDENIGQNEWLAVNQYTIIENNINRRPDVIVFVNGLPLVVFELKNLADEKTTVRQAYNQIQTYKNDIPSLFTYNSLCILSDGLDTRVGSLTADMDRFMKWKTIDGKTNAPVTIPEMEVLLRGMMAKERLLDIVNNFITFHTDNETTIKILAAYHQYFAVNKALESTVRATSEEDYTGVTGVAEAPIKYGLRSVDEQPKGDKRCGVVWHTQGSGKSLTMLFYAGKLIKMLNNPTIVVLTDRNDLDDQLFGVFSTSREILRQTPTQSQSREHLRELLKVASGGVVFTTIQKFLPEGEILKQECLSKRRNIVVIADEAHRSQYDFIDGFARHMHDALPNASYIGFTGTPIELTDANTRAVFGEYIDVYDIAKAVEDHATVPIYYEARLAKIQLLESERPHIDTEFEDLTEGEEVERKEKLKSKWARLEALVGAEKRIKLIAKDIIEHFEARMDTMDGKGMIVAMSRRIAVELYNEIVKLRPNWHSDSDSQGYLKVVMTGSAADPASYQPHIRGKEGRELLAKRIKNPSDELKLVIVRDMWLTGFDVPSLHTMYVDKPMKGHGLMQAIARVNRVYKDKQGGLIVDYIGLAPSLKEALGYYTESGRETPTIRQEDAVAILLEKYEVARDIFHGFDYSSYFGNSSADRTRILTEAINFVLGLEDGKKRYMQIVTELSHAFSLSVPHERAIQIRDEVAFFQTVKVGILKLEDRGRGGPTDEDYDQAIKQIVSNAITTPEVVDVFKIAGLDKPNVSVLSDEFLSEVKNLKYKNVAFELLKKLLNDEIRVLEKKYLVKSRSFAEMLENIIKNYQNKTIEAAQVIAELVELAKKIKGEKDRGATLNLREDEVAFYDALAMNDSAVMELGDETLKKIAQELVALIRKNTTIDWTLKENVRARLRIYVKKLLNKYRYPPDKQEKATNTVLEQAEVLCKDWKNSLHL